MPSQRRSRDLRNQTGEARKTRVSTPEQREALRAASDRFNREMRQAHDEYAPRLAQLQAEYDARRRKIRREHEEQCALIAQATLLKPKPRVKAA